MAITKNKKQELIREGAEEMVGARALIFADFTGTNVNDMNELRSELKGVGAKMSVIKKRLLKVLFGEKKVNLDPLKFEGPVSTVFVKAELSEVAGSLYRFSKKNEHFKLLGAYNLEADEEIDEITINAIGSLPSKNELIAKVVGSIAAPLRGLMYVLKAKAEKSS